MPSHVLVITSVGVIVLFCVVNLAHLIHLALAHLIHLALANLIHLALAHVIHLACRISYSF